jgi:regulation of enolase protein 1 (concanavalin A-like superfamily)
VVKDGQLTWPTEATDLSGSTSSQSGVLLRDQPQGNFVVETKLHIDTGVDVVRNYQQGGIVVYLADNHFLRLDVASVGATRIVEFGKRMTSSGVDSWGGSIIGPPAETTWLRLAHTVNPQNGEHLYRAASSRDGKHWIWGTTWTLPAGSTPRIGLVSQGSSAATEAQYGKATSMFDYFRVFRTAR